MTALMTALKHPIRGPEEEATPQQGSESWGSFTQKEHHEMSYGIAYSERAS